MGARFRLRRATSAAHARLDDLFSRFDLSIASGYVAFLCAQAPAFLAVERALDDAGASALIDGWTLRRRSDALRKDLADLGQTLPPGLPAPVVVTEPQILGAAYVLEGSRLGGAILARQVSSGLPVVRAHPQGFRHDHHRSSVPYDLGGKAHTDYVPSGVQATFCIPARHVSEARSIAGQPIKYPRPAVGHPQAVPTSVLDGHDVLLVEDSLIIALDAEDIVTRLGATTVAAAATVDAALETIDAAQPTIAMLDINLGDRNSYPIADRLMELNVPFLFATGYGEQATLPMEHRGRPVLQKPYTLENVARALDAIVGLPALSHRDD